MILVTRRHRPYGVGRRLQVGVTRPRHGRNLPYPLVMHHAFSLSIIRGRDDVVTRFILLLSADAYAMQLCKTGPLVNVASHEEFRGREKST